MLRWNQLYFAYEKTPVLSDFSEEIADGEILAVMGASGCGKSTLLAITAGLLSPQRGRIEHNARRISVVFQEPRLLPWYTVHENLRAVLPDTADREQKIKDALAAVELTGCEALRPDELSGGMKSRVAIARALAYDGDLYLLDEPFAALDEDLRERLGLRLRQRIKESGASAMLITHHSTDADRIADRIRILK